MPSNKIDSNIIDKIKNIVHYAQNHVIEETEQQIYESFPTDDLYITESSINTAYYQEYLKKIYIKGLDGIHFKLDKGPWDIFGENTSHTGTDLSLESPLSSKSPILLYDENFFQNDEDYDSQIDEMINSINYNEENIISALRDNDVELFNVISKDHINEKVLDFF